MAINIKIEIFWKKFNAKNLTGGKRTSAFSAVFRMPTGERIKLISTKDKETVLREVKRRIFLYYAENEPLADSHIRFNFAVRKGEAPANVEES